VQKKSKVLGGGGGNQGGVLQSPLAKTIKSRELANSALKVVLATIMRVPGALSLKLKEIRAAIHTNSVQIQRGGWILPPGKKSVSHQIRSYVGQKPGNGVDFKKQGSHWNAQLDG